MPQVSSRALVEGPVYVPGLPREYVAAKYGIPLDDIAKLGSAENPHGPSPKAVEALAKMDPKLDIYPDWTARPLREAIAKRYGFDPDCVVCGSGETEVISLVIRAFCGVGESILMHDPCFPIYRIFSTVEGRVPMLVRMGEDFDPVVDAYVARLAEKPRIAFITSPHNPTGRLLDETEVRRICDAADRETLVVLDEAYIHYSETDGMMHLLREYDNLIVLRTFSKAYGLAGLRVGFGIAANPDLIRPLRNIKPTWNMGHLQMAGGAAAVFDDEHVNRAVATVVASKAMVEAAMAKMNAFRMVPGCRSNFFLTEILDPDLDSTAVFNGLLERGVIVKDGTDIEGLGPRYLRVDLNLQKHMERFLGALRDIEMSKVA
ncbi:pyridoxal phosphate-dependent aminotransferase [Acuticoccus sediminis]|uniref:pyridoxal phosphate-dependent aminotransferase n=1 Tax=Acuticoccus sediminis TaxID=2184697 RepID=UPI0013913630|nr:histidinol-phosphate transaminase [Acuticoccus sediminis]